MELEGAGGSELAQLVADHRLGHIDRDVPAAVVDGDGVADHVRDDGRTTGPGLDDLLLPARVQHVHLLQQVVVDKWALLQATRHTCSTLRLSPRAAGAASTDDHRIGLLVAGPGATLGLAPRRHRMAPTRGLAFPTAERVVDRVHGHTAGLW